MADIPHIEGYADPVRVARGGFAVVYRARQERFDRVVALKVLSIDEIDDRARKRFERECRVMGSLSWHPNVVAVLDSGVADGHPWLAMEFLDAGSLGGRLERDGSLPWAEVLDIGVQVAGALGAAHASGVLHRDLKPENLLIGPFGETKLADFGIAAVEGGTRTTTGSASFTVAHVAPEILEGRPPDERADIYGLASTLHTLITGVPPFTGQGEESIATLITRILQTPAPRLTDVPEGLADVVTAALAKDPADRPPDAESFGRMLQAVQADQGQPTTPLRLAPTTATTTGQATPSTVPGATEGGPASVAPDRPAARTAPDSDPAVGKDTATDTDTDAATVASQRIEGAPPPVVRHASGNEGQPSAGGPARSRRTVVATVLVVALIGVALVAVLTRSGENDSGDRTPVVTATIDVGASPREVAVTEEGIWVTTYEDDTVVRIDPQTNEAAATPLQDNGPQGISSSPRAVWVGNYSDGTLSEVDPVTGEATNTIELRGSPQDVSAIGDTVWVALLDDAAVAVDFGHGVDGRVGEPIRVSRGPQGIAATDDAVWVTSIVADVVTRIDPATGNAADIIPTGGAPWGVAATTDSVWVTNSGDGTLVRIDPDTMTITDTIDVGADPLGVAVTDDAVWVALAGDNTVVRIDPDTMTITATVDVGAGPQGIAATDDTVWVANEGDGTVTRIDLS